MKLFRIVLAAVCVAAFLAGRGTWVDADLPPVGSPLHGSTTSVSELGTAGEPFAARRGTLVDRYGNPIDRAVVDYRIDYRGEVYERHSPHTELAKLGPPRS
jgi:hypothetical protein